MANTDALRERVAESCRVLGTLDLTKAATGHVSARIPGTNRFLMRARGDNELGVRYTTADQVIECDLDGKLIDARDDGVGLPIEVFIHSAVYKARPEVNSVIHMHPPTVVLFTIVDKPLLPIFGAYDPSAMRLALDGIPRFDSSVLISNPELGAQLAATLGNSATCLMRGHGITTAGPTVEEASLYAIQLNELAEMNYRALLIGTPRPISEADKKSFGSITLKGDKQGPDGRPIGRQGALWRYYVELTGA